MGAKDVEVYQLPNWGRKKKVRNLPAFLVSKEERKQFMVKNSLRGRPKKLKLTRSFLQKR